MTKKWYPVIRERYSVIPPNIAPRIFDAKSAGDSSVCLNELLKITLATKIGEKKNKEERTYLTRKPCGKNTFKGIR